MTEYTTPDINPQQRKSNCHRIYAKDNSFFIIDGKVAADPRLSLECKGFYFMLLTAEAAQQYDRQVLKGFDIVWNEKHCEFAHQLIELGYLEEVTE